MSVQCAASQLSAALASTCSGTESASAGIGASTITAVTTGSVFSTSASGTSNTSSSCTCKQHLRCEFLLRQSRVHADHGAADDVGGGALQPRIDRGALVERADRGIRSLDVRIVTFAAEQRFDVAVFRANSLVSSM